jgi:hypothetical protein
MDLNIDPVILNGSNYAIWAPDMETLLKSKEPWQYIKTVIPDPTDDQENLVVYGKKVEVVGIITTYISWDILFHINGINFLHQVWKKLKSLFDRVDEIHVMQLEKELISIDPHSFDIIEDYLVHLK